MTEKPKSSSDLIALLDVGLREQLKDPEFAWNMFQEMRTGMNEDMQKISDLRRQIAELENPPKDKPRYSHWSEHIEWRDISSGERITKFTAIDKGNDDYSVEIQGFFDDCGKFYITDTILNPGQSPLFQKE